MFMAIRRIPLSGIFVVILFVLSTTHSYSQIYSSTSSSRVETNYPDYPFSDSVFVFCGSPGQLTAHIDGNPGPFDFTWSLYDPISGSFEEYATGSGPTHSISNLDDGGYRVHITNGVDVDEEFRAWVFSSLPTSSASLQNVICGSVALGGIAEAATFMYYDPLSNQAVDLPTGRNFLWSSRPASAIPFPSVNLNPITFDPPVVDTWYILTVTDLFECQSADSVFYESIETRADFTFNPSEGPSPLLVSFTSQSQNASSYEWFFDYGVTGEGLPDALEENPEHLYLIPGQYRAALRTYSPQGCPNFFESFDFITVTPSSLEVPNVFTPDGDGYNDVFIVSHNSMQAFHGVIYNRSGRKVFEWTNPDIGWDGKLPGGSEASPGAYFYIITGVGWDGKKYELTGTAYLFRK